GAVAVHRGVATAQYHHALALHVDEVFRRLLETEVAVDVGNEEVQRVVDARQVLAGEAALHVVVGPRAQDQGIVCTQQLRPGRVRADLGVQTELDTHAGEYFTAAAEHGLFQLELGDTEGQQATDFRVLVEHHRGHTVTHQHVGATEAGRAGADHRDTLSGRLDLGHVRAPAHGEGGVGDVLLHRTDGHRAEAVIEGAGTFAEAVLRAHAAADFRQGVGLVRELGGRQEGAVRDQLEPVRNEVVYRALPLAIRVAAAQAAMRLVGSLRRLEVVVDLDEFLLALTQQFLLRVFAPDFDELEVVVQTFSHCITSSNHFRRILIAGWHGCWTAATSGWPLSVSPARTCAGNRPGSPAGDRKSTRLNSSHV